MLHGTRLTEPNLTEMTHTPSLGVQSQPAAPAFQRMDTAAARDVHRHSRFVRILRWVLPLFCLLIVGMFLFSSGILHEFFFPKPPEAQPVIAENAVEMVQPRMSGLDEKKRPYEITAKSARQDVNNPSKVTLENITGSLTLNETDGKVLLKAKSGFLDTEKSFLKLRQDIIITSKQGYTAYLISADAKLKKKHITTKDPVLIEWEDGSINANALEITDNGNVIRFYNRVKVKLRPKPGKKDANG